MTDPIEAPAAADLAPLDAAGADRPRAGATRLESLLDMTLPVTIEFGRTTLTMQEILDLGPGSVIQLDRLVGEAVDIYVSDRRMAEGEVVVIGERFGIRVTRVLPQPRENNGRPGEH